MCCQEQFVNKTITDLLEAHNKFDGLSFKSFLDNHAKFVKQYDNVKTNTRTNEFVFSGLNCQYTTDNGGFVIESKINI